MRGPTLLQTLEKILKMRFSTRQEIMRGPTLLQTLEKILSDKKLCECQLTLLQTLEKILSDKKFCEGQHFCKLLRKYYQIRIYGGPTLLQTLEKILSSDLQLQ
jgi:hypothetical protein